MEIVYRPEKIDRRSVSIPKSLLEEMRKHTNVNWSAVACRAFE